MNYARVVTTRAGQQIELPDDMRLTVDEVEIRQDGDTLMLRPSGRTYGERLVETMERLAELIDRPDEIPTQPRQDL